MTIKHQGSLFQTKPTSQGYGVRMLFIETDKFTPLCILATLFIPSLVSAVPQLQHSTGYVLSSSQNRLLRSETKISYSSKNYVVPSKYSMQGRTGPAEDQGKCGSCWDFALTSALRGALVMAGNDPGPLSFNYLLNCTGPQQNGCYGGDFSAASFLKHPLGAPSFGADGPYIAKQGRCESAPIVASATDYHFIGSDTSLPSFQDIAYVIGVLHRPVTIDIAVDWRWDNYSGGLFDGCKNEIPREPNHMVVVEGYDCESSIDNQQNCTFDTKGNLAGGTGTLILRNSWGSDWGEKGYITVRFSDLTGRRCNSMALTALYFDVLDQETSWSIPFEKNRQKNSPIDSQTKKPSH